ncbi:MAG TPA: hypothetical protein V6D20_11125 [Candidatus Obscuribacterales bacterium]
MVCYKIAPAPEADCTCESNGGTWLDPCPKHDAPEADSTSETPSKRKVEVWANNHKHCPAMVVDASDFAWAMQQVEARERELAQAIKQRDEAQRIGPIEPNFYTAKLEQQLATLREALEIILKEDSKIGVKLVAETALASTNQNQKEQRP